MEESQNSDKQPSEILVRAVELIERSFKRGGKLLICGNGGSAADASHMAGELVKSFEKKRELTRRLAENLENAGGDAGVSLSRLLHIGLPAISLAADGAVISAIVNDIGADAIFAQQVFALGNDRDTLLCISTSGESQNIMYAALTAKAQGMQVIGLVGNRNCRLAEYCSLIIAAGDGPVAEIQSEHQRIYHEICRMIEDRLPEWKG